MEIYDLCIIGGGPTGYAAAMRALDFNKKVILIEKDRLGGAQVFDGVMASKTLWEYSERIRNVREITRNNDVAENLTYDEVSEEVNNAIFERKTQLTYHLRLLQEQLPYGMLTYEKGSGYIIDKNTVRISGDGIKEIKTKFILICTGSSPRILPNVLVDETNIMTSDGIHHMEEFPKSLVILGAGIIGCEYATMFSNFGKTKVYLIDKAERILPFEDEDVTGIVTKNLEKNGVTIHKEATLIRMEKTTDGMVEYEIACKGKENQIFKVDKALISIGRVANSHNIGLENVNIKVNDAKQILDDDTQTSVPNIYTAGDVSGRISLVNVGEREARHAVVLMFGEERPRRIRYNNISTIMFLNPEVAAVGMNEQEARAKKIRYKLAKVDYGTIARAIAMRKTDGFFKILVSDDDEMKILGMRAVGEHASSAIQAVALLISMNKGIDELTQLMHPHPSIIEGIQECVRMLKGKSIYKPSVFRDRLQCYTCHDGICTPLYPQ
jgi:dihydrolipoamide dehydrogenase